MEIDVVEDVVVLGGKGAVEADDVASGIGVVGADGPDGAHVGGVFLDAVAVGVVENGDRAVGRDADGVALVPGAEAADDGVPALQWISHEAVPGGASSDKGNGLLVDAAAHEDEAPHDACGRRNFRTRR